MLNSLVETWYVPRTAGSRTDQYLVQKTGPPIELSVFTRSPPPARQLMSCGSVSFRPRSEQPSSVRPGISNPVKSTNAGSETAAGLPMALIHSRLKAMLEAFFPSKPKTILLRLIASHCAWCTALDRVDVSQKKNCHLHIISHRALCCLTCPLSRVWCLSVVSRVRCLCSVCPAQAPRQ